MIEEFRDLPELVKPFAPSTPTKSTNFQSAPVSIAEYQPLDKYFLGGAKAKENYSTVDFL
jgi:hypothetical protein